MRPLQLAEADSTMLPPLVQLSFAFSGNGAGKVYYTSNLDPEHPWIADITVAENNGKIVITQQDAAKKRVQTPKASRLSLLYLLSLQTAGVKVS